MKNSNKGLIFGIILSLTIVGLLLLSFLAGYRFLTVVSPSMATAAPVGSLVVSKSQNHYEKGDIISFSRNGKIYTHRIVEIQKDGKFITKGDLNASNDALPVEKHDIIGSAVYIGKYIGWIWRALPIIVIGVVIAYIISLWKKITVGWKWPVRIIGYCISVMVATFILNPWIRIELVGGYEPVENGVKMSIVNTGIFPIKDENGERFYAGEVRSVIARDIDEHGRFVYIPRPSLGFWGMVFVLLWCLLPLIFAMTVKLPLSEEQENLEEEEFEKEKRVSGIIFAVVLVASIVFLVMQLSTFAAFTASITNSQNIMRTNDYFTCQATQSATANPRPIIAYGLNTFGPGNTEPDISGNNRNGTIVGRIVDVSSRDGACVRDRQQDAIHFDGRTTCISNSFRMRNPNTFTVEAWFNTTTANAGKIIGFGDNLTTNDYHYDRHIYVGNSGSLNFATYPGTQKIVSDNSKNYADGRWHHVVGTLSNQGMFFYVDGKLVAQDIQTKSAENYEGYWKVGCGKLSTWRNTTGPAFFTGAIRNAAVYDVALTEEQVRTHYAAGK